MFWLLSISHSSLVKLKNSRIISCFLITGSFSSFQEAMKERKILSVILLTSLTFLLMARFTSSCNQMLCASIVSKCMLTQSCKCDLKNCTCCRDCYQCLSWLWKECCSCVGKTSFLFLFSLITSFPFFRFVPQTKRHKEQLIKAITLRATRRHSWTLQCTS